MSTAVSYCECYLYLQALLVLLACVTCVYVDGHTGGYWVGVFVILGCVVRRYYNIYNVSLCEETSASL